MIKNTAASPVSVPQQQIISVVTDDDLRIKYHSPALTHWLSKPKHTFRGEPLINLFPKIADHQKAIKQRQDVGDSYTFYLDKRIGGDELQLCLQVERLPKKRYLVTVTAVSSTQQIQQLESQNRVLQLLNKASQALIESLDTEVVLERILEATNQIIGAQGSSVWLWDDIYTECLVCRAAYYPNHVKSLLNQRIKQGQGVAGWVGLYGKSALVLDTQNDNRFYAKIDTQSGFITNSIIAVPLNLREETIGVLEIVNKIGGAFTQTDLMVAETIAASAAIGLDNARLVDALQKQMDDLQAQNEELDAFDHSVAHDLQNPLSLIVGFTDVLRQAEQRNIPEKDRKTALEMIISSAQKMSTIIHELLLLSSIRKVEVKKEPMDMGEIVDAALLRLSKMIEASNAEVTRPDVWPVALGYGPWIEEVWENYLSNAIKYGGNPAQIELGATLEDDDRIARFWVRDNGGGLTEEEQSRLFTPFTRLNDIRVTGQGLGLSIVQRIMNKLDGAADVESTVGEGSVFSFALPIADM